MPSAVLDSYAILALLFRERGHNKATAVITRAFETGADLLVASPNWAEVRYIVERKVGTDRWRETRTKLLGLPIEIVPPDVELAVISILGETLCTKI